MFSPATGKPLLPAQGGPVLPGAIGAAAALNHLETKGKPGALERCIWLRNLLPLLKVNNFEWFNTENPLVGKKLKS